MLKTKHFSYSLIALLAATAGLNCSMAEMYDEASGDDDWADFEPDISGDRYDDVGTNPFVAAAHDPFSTFAADVDSASYDIFRRDVNDGMLPAPKSVRLEEYINYFHYDYPAPNREDEHPFAISLDGAPNILEQETTLFRVGIQAVQPAPFEKRPTNLVFLVDTSGSMTAANKLPLVQYLLNKSLDVLDPTDKVSIVTYASETGVKLEPTPVSQGEKIKNAIDALNSGGSTAGASGIELAYQQAEAAFLPNGINRVFLCTDGDFNVGPSSDEALVDLIEQKRQTGITLTVIGFGRGNLNDSMMEKISNAGNGIYAVISDRTNVDRYVARRLLASIDFVAKDMKIQIEFNPDFVKAYRLLGYENRAIDDNDFNDDTVDGGEVGAGHRVTALYELVLTGGSVPAPPDAPQLDDGPPVEGEREIDPADLALVQVRYKASGAAANAPSHLVEKSIQAADIASDPIPANSDFQWLVAVAAFAEMLKNSPFADFDALTSLDQIFNQNDWGTATSDPDRAEFLQLFNQAKTRF